MCGIIGYIGKTNAIPILLDGLRRLEYRGYDSAGVAVLNGSGIEVRKRTGRIANLAALLQQSPIAGQVGISHTRWATHGGVSDENAHPHFDRSGKLALVHNGVIENYSTLRETLERDGHTFKSQTDTEVLAHLIGKHYDSAGGEPSQARLVEALRMALKQVVGTYGIVMLHSDLPNITVGARRGSPLVLGLGAGENFFASDVSAIVAYTREAVYLKDYDIAVLSRDRFEISSLLGGTSGFEVSKVEFTEEDVSKGDYPHYMLKEIFEQPQTFEGRGFGEAGWPRNDGGGIANRRAHHPDGLWHGEPCGDGGGIHHRGAGACALRSRVRQRVPLPKHAAAKGFARLLHQPERGDGGHPRCTAGKPAQGASNAWDLQQRRLDDRAGERWRRLYARGTGDRCRGDEVVHFASNHHGSDRFAARANPAS
jgi:Glutamine amidotransferase domain